MPAAAESERERKPKKEEAYRKQRKGVLMKK